jgi:hypothetical protein
MMPEDRKELYALIEEWTRCEIMARFGPFWPECGEYSLTSVAKEDAIRELMFGTSDLVRLGKRWGLLKEYEKKRKFKEKERQGNMKEKGKRTDEIERVER